MTITTGWNPNLFSTELSTITKESSKSCPTIYPKLVETMSWSKDKFPAPNKVVTHRVAGLGPFEESFETSTYAQDDLIKGPKKTTAFKLFNLAVEFSEVVLDDDQFNVCRQYAGELGLCYEKTRDIQVATLFDSAFSTTNYTDADGAAICSTSHTRYDGGADRQNMLTQSAAFSYQSLKDIMTVSYRQVDERGYPAPQFNPNQKITVLLQPEDQYVGIELFSQLANYKPTDDTNAVNVIKGMDQTFDVVINPYQTQTGNGGNYYWFLINQNQPDIWLVDRWPLKTKMYVREGNDNTVYAGRARYAIHVNHWRGVMGSGN